MTDIVYKETNKGVEQGLNQLLDENPLFEVHREFLKKHVDNSIVNDSVNGFLGELMDRSKYMPKNKFEDYFAQSLHNFKTGITELTSVGQTLDKPGKIVTLKDGSLELEKKEKGLFSRVKDFFVKGSNSLDTHKYLGKTITAFTHTKEIFETGNYAQYMPELEKSISFIYKMGFLAPAVDFLKGYNLLDSKTYKKIFGKLKTGAENAVKYTAEQIGPWLIKDHIYMTYKLQKLPHQ